jgi:hypothetical protein
VQCRQLLAPTSEPSGSSKDWLILRNLLSGLGPIPTASTYGLETIPHPWELNFPCEGKLLG